MRKKKPSAAALGATGKPADVPLDTGGFFVSFCRALGSAQEGTNVAVAVVLMILHAIAFLCTVIMSQVDTIVAVRGGYGPGVPETTWVVALLNAPGFSGLLRTWKNSDQVRPLTLPWMDAPWLPSSFALLCPALLCPALLCPALTMTARCAWWRRCWRGCCAASSPGATCPPWRPRTPRSSG